MTKFGRTARVTTAILAVLVLVQCFLLFIQHRQIEALVGVDCAAYEERVARQDLYVVLENYWRGRDEAVADAYAAQNAQVQLVIDAGAAECDPSRG